MTRHQTLAIGLLASLSSATVASATESGTFYGHHSHPPTTPMSLHPASRTHQLPAGVTPREMFRLYKRGQHHTTLHYVPQNWEEIGWQREASLGVISATPFENSRPLYMCQLNNIAWGYLTSGDPGCEGQFLTPFGLIGYISSVPLPSTRPLYRCNYIHKGQLKHFDTHQPNCENVPLASNDGIQGYVF